jgi:hypothetical protein
LGKVLTITGAKGGTPVAESVPVRIEVEDGMDVSVTVHPILNGAAVTLLPGTFSCAVRMAAGITGVSGALIPLNVGNAAKIEITLSVDGTEHTASAAPGYYLLTVQAKKGTQSLTWREVVHIYSSTVTYKAYDLTEADFASAIYLAGTLTGGIAGYSAETVRAYGDAACVNLLAASAVSASAPSATAWGLAIDVPSIDVPPVDVPSNEDAGGTVWFKVKLAKSDGGSITANPSP